MSHGAAGELRSDRSPEPAGGNPSLAGRHPLHSGDRPEAIDWPQLCAQRLDAGLSLPSITRIRMPRPPRALAELAELTRNPDADVRAVASLVERDSQLTSQVLKLVNSCAVGLKTKISSIPRAVTILGPRRSKMLVMSAMLEASLGVLKPNASEDEGFLNASLERAFFARYTAETLGANAECAYIATLLQDLLLPHLIAEYSSEYSRYNPHDESLPEFERRTFGWDHATVAGQLLQSWSFPPDVTAAVLYHHDASWVHGHETYQRSLLAASSASGLLPDARHQEPNGIAGLMRFQEHVPDFNFLQAAVQTDEQMEWGQPGGGHRTALCDRLSRLALAHVEEKRSEIIWTERTIGSYTLEQQLGQGAMGVVYRARHSMLRRPAAVKLMKTTQFDAQALERFEREAQLTSELTSPHTIKVYDYGMTSHGVLYYAMEHLDGLSLRELVESYGMMPEGRTIYILRQVCASLAEAHATGLIHRDIKPENIFITMHGGVGDFVKVLDFGLAMAVSPGGAASESETAVCGTPLYLAPEAILQPDSVDHRADIYALGVMAYYLLTSEFPLNGGSVREILHAQLDEIPAPPSNRIGRPISTDLEQIVMQCLEKERNRRPANVSQLARQLAACNQTGQWNPERASDWWQRNGEVPLAPFGGDPSMNFSFSSTPETDNLKTVITAAH